MLPKKDAQSRRRCKSKGIIERSGLPRVVVRKTLKHVTASVAVRGLRGDHTIAFASSSEHRSEFQKAMSKMEKAKIVGCLLAEKILQAGISKVAFDRSGYLYHGVVQILGDSIREKGVTI